MDAGVGDQEGYHVSSVMEQGGGIETINEHMQWMPNGYRRHRLLKRKNSRQNFNVDS